MKIRSFLHGIVNELRNVLRIPGLTHPGSVNDDSMDVTIAASLLQITEFHFFHVAHAQWFGRSIPDSSMEQIFSAYIFEDIVPHWVRQLTRKVLALHKQGSLDPEEFDIKRPVVTPEMRANGEWYIILLLIIVVFYCIMISNFEPLQ